MPRCRTRMLPTIPNLRLLSLVPRARLCKRAAAGGRHDLAGRTPGRTVRRQLALEEVDQLRQASCTANLGGVELEVEFDHEGQDQADGGERIEPLLREGNIVGPLTLGRYSVVQVID